MNNHPHPNMNKSGTKDNRHMHQKTGSHHMKVKDAGHKDHHTHMTRDFRNRCWISLLLTVPVLILSPMLQKFAGLREAVHFPGDIYILFLFSSAVFWYGGWPFLKGLFKEIKSRQPGMMTLVAVAIRNSYPLPGITRHQIIRIPFLKAGLTYLYRSHTIASW